MGASVTHDYHYRVFGLQLAADQPIDSLPLPAARASDRSSGVDVRVSLHPPASFWERVAEDPVEAARTIEIGTDGPLEISRTPRGWIWHYPDDTRFFLSAEADDIRVSWPQHYVVQDALTYLLGPIMGFTLRLRGVRSLHASCAVVGDRAICFVGPRGAGKSTMAAALYRQGHDVVSEDVTALPSEGTALPGLPFVKLWEDSARTHGELPLLTPNWSKRYLPVADRFATEPVELGTVFLLGRGPRPVVEEVRPAEALATLLNNVYVSYALTDAMRADDLEFFGDLVERVPVRRLKRTASLQDLDAVVRLVERESQA
jgi:hypothetical protein